MMIHEGGGLVGRFFTHNLLAQWMQLLVLIEDYPYVGMDYKGDDEMPRPPGQAWDLMVRIHDVLCGYIHI